MNNDRYAIILDNLEKSNFRSSFKLKKKDIEYIEKNGLDRIESHAYDFITARLAPAVIANDGKQTPMHNHPVFIAQHATATCCRTCLYKWHRIKPGTQLTKEQIDYIVNIIMMWIKRQLNNRIEIEKATNVNKTKIKC